MGSEQTAINDVVARLKHGGGSADDIQKLQSRGLTADEAKGLLADLSGSNEPPQLKGARATELEAVQLRRTIADQADVVASLSPDQGIAGEAFVEPYEVGNPHDKQETVDLFIRPLSIPPSWKAYIANVADAGSAAESDSSLQAGAKYPVTEVEAGKHYSVSLPPKTEIRVASVLVPESDVGANTTARWAVEGKIGNEAIGTMVHDMNVPYTIADMKLPAVGTQEVMEEGGGPISTRSRTGYMVWIAAGAAAVIAMLLFLVWRRRQQSAAR